MFQEASAEAANVIVVERLEAHTGHEGNRLIMVLFFISSLDFVSLFLRVFHILETLGGFPSIEAVSYQRAELRASHHSNKGSKEHADDADQSSNCSEHIQGR